MWRPRTPIVILALSLAAAAVVLVALRTPQRAEAALTA